MPDPIAEIAEQVLRDLGMWRLPVKPLSIAQEEGIELGPSNYGYGFDARIEYYPSLREFGILYQQPGLFRSAGRVNFSLGHELGHFYLPEHRLRLISGRMHNSIADYGSRDPAEAEADRFAASLLMPKELFMAEIRSFRGGFCTLADLCIMSDRLGTSVMSTAIRYCDCELDATTIIVSRDRRVEWVWTSEDMKRLGMYFVPYGSTIPSGTRTAALYDQRDLGAAVEIVEGSVDSHSWFEWPKRPTVWEEAMFLGDRVLTYLASAD